jgi:hypothetical protein
MKQNKAPGNDKLTCDIIKIGANEAVTQITKIFNTILKIKRSHQKENILKSKEEKDVKKEKNGNEKDKKIDF